MDVVRDLILRKLKEAGLTMAKASEKIGRNPAYLQQFLKRGIPAEMLEKERVRLAAILGVNPDDLRGPSNPLPAKEYAKRPEHEEFTESRKVPIDNAIPARQLLGEQDLPVFGAAEGGRGALILSSEPIDRVVRPDPLLRVRDGYGVLIIEDSMAPEFRSGDIALVNPHLPARAGDTCIFRHEAEDGTQTAIIKYLRRATAAEWLVTEWNAADGSGPREFKLKRSEWQLAHVTVGNYKRR